MSTTAYEAYVQGQLSQAAGVQLVELLYRGAIEAIDQARACLQQRDIPGRARQINRAYEILAELLISLNKDAGGELAERLASLYVYIQNLLLRAHAEQAEPPLQEARQLLATLLEAWQQIGRPGTVVEASPIPAPGAEVTAGQLDCLA